MAACDPFEPMTFDIDLDCCIAKILCNGLVKYAFNLGTTKIVETGVNSYRISDGIDSWTIPSDQGSSYASDIAALWSAICSCRSNGALGEANLDRELVELCYDAIDSGTGYSIGDRITRVMILDVTTDPSTVESSIYINKTTGSAISPDLADLQVCTALGDCATPLFNISALEAFCVDGVTLYGKRPCTPEEDPVFYDWQGNIVNIGASTAYFGECPTIGLTTINAISYANNNTANAPIPEFVKKVSFKNDAATDLEVSFDDGATYPLIVNLATGIVSFGDGHSVLTPNAFRFRGSVTSKYTVWWEY